jgi:hypothetical protein
MYHPGNEPWIGRYNVQFVTAVPAMQLLCSLTHHRIASEVHELVKEKTSTWS